MKASSVRELDKPARNQRLRDADGQLCPYCSCTMDRGDIKKMPTADHIRARALVRLPGQTRKSLRKKGRTIIVCSECNFMKGTLTLEQFIIDLIAKNKILVSQVEANVSRMQNIRYLLDIGLDRSENG